VIRLLRVELLRVWSRRTVRLLLVLLVVGLLGVAGKLAASSNRDLAAARAAATRQAQQIAQNAPAPARASCQPPSCSLPTAAQLYQDPRFSFADNGGNLVNGAVIATALLGLVIGATVVGADWAAGTFAALLMWEPRRLRVGLAKLLAPVAVAVGVGVLTIAFELGSGALIAATRGTMAHTTASLLGSLVVRGVRGLALVALLTAVGVGISGLVRHSAAALGVAVGYLVAFEMVLRHTHPQWERWLLSTNAAAVVTGHLSLFDAVGGFKGIGPVHPFVLSAGRGALYLCLVVAALLAIAATALVRRDVT
jgi:ABC-2 type transport system permease protein